jgi:triacylglycerol esterase/lipase EstA (alpha/beta hydrolase family)
MLPRENGPMSPRRRALLVGLAAVVALAAVVLGIRSRGGAAITARPVPQDKPGPVLLVPGYGGSMTGLEELARVLRAKGHDATVVPLPGDGTGDLREAAKALDTAARSTGAGSVDVVGYSAGGVTARYWVKELGGDALARRVITLGSPHHGTKLASLGAAFAPGACGAACQQLVPGSDLLDGLNSGDETPAGPEWLSVWTAQDETVTPPESARLDGAVDVVLQDVCPGATISHGGLPTAPLVQGLVLRAVGVGDIRAPDPADCAALTSAR